MQLTDILDGDAVKTLTSCTSKKRLFQDIAALAESVYGTDATAVNDALLERESLGPTAVGSGIAIPHARLAGVDQVRGMFMRLECTLEFNAADRQPVVLVFALLAPEIAGVEHLKALALISRTLRETDMQAKLRANADAATLHTILTEAQAQAA